MEQPLLKKQKLEESKTIDSKWLKSITSKIKKSIELNTQLRSKYPNEPLKFFDSESDLNTLLDTLTNLTQSKTPLFNELIENFDKDELIILLNHPNFDIVSTILKLFYDIIDVEYEDDEEKFIDWLKKVNFVEILIEIIIRSTQSIEENEIDAESILEIIDTLLDYQSTELKRSIVKNKQFIKKYNQVLKNLKDDESSEKYMDLLYKLITSNESKSPIIEFLTKHEEIIEILLHQLNSIKEYDEENGYLSSILLNLKVLLSENLGIKLFLKNEGFELLNKLINIENGNELITFNIFVQLSNLLLESNINNEIISKKIISSTGVFLKNFFKNLSKLKEVDDIYQYIKILTKLFELLPFESKERLRIVNKIIDNDFKNFKLLKKIETKYAKRLEYSFDYNDEDYSERLWDGLNVIQQYNILLCWLFSEDKSLKTQLIKKFKLDIEMITDVIKGYQDELEMNQKLIKEGSIEESQTILDNMATQLETINELSKVLENN